MAKDPACGMNVDPQSAAGKSDYKGQVHYFAARDAKLRSRKIRRNIFLPTTNIRPIIINMKRYLAVTSLLLVVLLLVACRPRETSISGKQVQVQGGAYTEISVDALQLMLKDKDFVLVNVHIPFEGDIPNTDISIPYDQIAQSLDQLTADKNAEIVLYCRSDRMSTIASETLVGLGYTNIYNLDGGMVAWENAGLDLER